MKIATYTRITLDREEEKRKFNELMEDKDWTVCETIGNKIITFEKISELIITWGIKMEIKFRSRIHNRHVNETMIALLSPMKHLVRDDVKEAIEFTLAAIQEVEIEDKNKE